MSAAQPRARFCFPGEETNRGIDSGGGGGDGLPFRASLGTINPYVAGFRRRPAKSTGLGRAVGTSNLAANLPMSIHRAASFCDARHCVSGERQCCFWQSDRIWQHQRDVPRPLHNVQLAAALHCDRQHDHQCEFLRALNEHAGLHHWLRRRIHRRRSGQHQQPSVFRSQQQFARHLLCSVICRQRDVVVPRRAVQCRESVGRVRITSGNQCLGATKGRLGRDGRFHLPSRAQRCLNQRRCCCS